MMGWTVLGFAMVVPATVIIGPVMIVSGLLFLPRWFIDRVYVAFSSVAMLAMRARVGEVLWAVEPKHLPKQTIIVCNHESLVDTQAMVVALMRIRSMRWIAKRILFWIPVMGWALWATGNVPVLRANTGKDIERLGRSGARRRDRDVAFFPEGTRSRSGNVEDFKKGAFVMAILTQRPILPMAIAGAAKCLPPDSLRPQKGEVVFAVGAPIPVDGLTYEDRDTLRDKAHRAVTELREIARQRLQERALTA